MSTAIPYAEFLGSNDPWPVLGNTAGRIREIASEMTAEQIATPARPGKWSVHQIVAHLADTELVCQARVRMMMFEDAPLLVAYDQDRWVNGWSREDEPFDATLERFRVLRESTLRCFRSATEHDLKRYGTHQERGVQLAGDYIILLAGHDVNHLSQIEAIRAAI